MAKVIVGEHVKDKDLYFDRETYYRKVRDIVLGPKFKGTDGREHRIVTGKVTIGGFDWSVYWHDDKEAYIIEHLAKGRVKQWNK